jgi:hypothetical protein
MLEGEAGDVRARRPGIQKMGIEREEKGASEIRFQRLPFGDSGEEISRCLE